MVLALPILGLLGWTATRAALGVDASAPTPQPPALRLALAAPDAGAVPAAPASPAAGAAAGARRAGDRAVAERRWLVLPLIELDRARIEALYLGLQAAGTRPVGPESRLGIDRAEAEPPLGLARVDDVRAAVLEARAALRRLDIERVEAALAEAMGHYLRLAAPDRQVDLLADVVLLRAEVALAQDRAERIADDLRLLARLDPSRLGLHAGLYPPALVQAFAAARADNERAGEASLVLMPRIYGGGRPALRLDGAPVSAGTVPVRAGPHLLTVEAPGLAPRSYRLHVEPGSATLFEAFLAPDAAVTERAALRRRLRAGFARGTQPLSTAAAGDVDVDDSVRADLGALARWTGADAILCVDATGFWLYRADAGWLSRRRVPSSSEPLAWATDAVGTSASARPPPAVASGQPPPEAAGRAADAALAPWAWWTVGAAGAALVGAAGLLAYLLWPADPVARPPRPLVITCCAAGGS